LKNQTDSCSDDDGLNLYPGVRCSDLYRDTGHLASGFRGFPPSLQALAGVTIRLNHNRFPSKSFTIHFSAVPIVRRYIVPILTAAISN
jgi:hypothetical protein